MLDPQNVSMLALLVAGGAWVLLLIVLLVDLFSDARLAVIWKILWLPVLLGVPMVSGLLYSAVCLMRSLGRAEKE